MTIADALLRPLYKVRGVIGSLGFHPYTVEIHRGAWDGDRTGEGSEATMVFPLVEGGGNPPEVELLNDEQIALGPYNTGSLRVGPITPAFEVDGIRYGATPQDLNGSNLDAGMTQHYLVKSPAHPQGQKYQLKKLDDSDTTGYFVTIEPTGG